MLCRNACQVSDCFSGQTGRFLPRGRPASGLPKNKPKASNPKVSKVSKASRRHVRGVPKSKSEASKVSKVPYIIYDAQRQHWRVRRLSRVGTTRCFADKQAAERYARVQASQALRADVQGAGSAFWPTVVLFDLVGLSHAFGSVRPQSSLALARSPGVVPANKPSTT